MNQLDELRKMSERHPRCQALREFYLDVAAIYHHDPTTTKDLDWVWLMAEARRRLKDLS